MARPVSAKHKKLIDAAMEQYHKKGYARTSLADVAKAAGVAVGNVFYYFKAKDDLAKAVVDEWCAMLAGYLADLEQEPDPWRRIEGFITQATAMKDIYVTLGCPLAGLTRDLHQEGGALRAEAARIYSVQFDWLQEQFAAGGVSQSDAKTHTCSLMTTYHGAILLGYTQNDGSVIDEQVARLVHWIRSMKEDAAAQGKSDM